MQMTLQQKIAKVLAGGTIPATKAKELVKVASLKKARKLIYQDEVTSGGNSIIIALNDFRLALKNLGIIAETHKEVLQIASGVSRELYKRR